MGRTEKGEKHLSKVKKSIGPNVGDKFMCRAERERNLVGVLLSHCLSFVRVFSGRE